MEFRRRFVTFCTMVVIALGFTTKASATWSIVLVDQRTKEVGVGTVTCLTSFNLLRIVPVVVVGKGAAACQAAGDFDGVRRPVIFSGLNAGLSPAEILAEVAMITGHQQRQYGIADVDHESVTFTGTANGRYRGGRAGRIGDISYAVQGNVLAGECVVDAIEDAVLNTPGDLAEKIMAAHVAARDTGGDGRCSCTTNPPDSCGCPPPPFTKSGHIGCIAVARIGDTDDPNCNANGCADGDYFLTLNVAFQQPSSPDPVDQLLGDFMVWRASLEGRPDAIRSIATLGRTSLIPGRPGATTLSVDLRDDQGLPIDVSIASLRVEHAPESAALSRIGAVVDHGDGTYTVPITLPKPTDRARGGEGIDRFRIVVDDGVRPVSLMPDPALAIRRAEAPGPR